MLWVSGYYAFLFYRGNIGAIAPASGGDNKGIVPMMRVVSLFFEEITLFLSEKFHLYGATL